MTDEWMFQELRWARKANGLTLTAVASAIGISRDTLRKYEEGRVDPPFFRVVKWAEALGYEVDLMMIERRRAAE